MAIQTITMQIPDRVILANATRYGWTGFLADGITPQTRPQFVKQLVIRRLIADTKEQEGNTLAAAAVNNNSTDIDNNISIT